MRIRNGLHLVASGRSGIDLTEALDCNVYMIDAGPAGFVLFDSGAGLDPDAIIDAIRDGGVDPRDVSTLFLTHGHADHSGGAEPLRVLLPHLQVWAGPRTAEILAGRDERLISLDRARGTAYPDDYRWTAPAVDRVLAPDSAHVVGDLSITFVETPGHSADHGSYLVRRGEWSALVSGDAVFAGGRVILQDILDCSVSATIATIRKLATLDFEAFLPGHGAFSLAAGRRHVDAALQHVATGAPPPNLF